MKNVFTILLLVGFTSASYAQNSKAALTKGYRGMVEGGFSVAPMYNCDVGPQGWYWEVSTTHGYQFNPYLFLGGGIGVLEEYDVILPFFVDFKANFNKKRISPYANLKLGYTANTTKGLDGGAYANLLFGLRFGIYKKLALNLSFGYAVQRVHYFESNESCSCSSPNKNAEKTTNSFISKIGIEF